MKRRATRRANWLIKLATRCRLINVRVKLNINKGYRTRTNTAVNHFNFSIILWVTCKRLNSHTCTLASSPILYVFLN